MGLWFVNLMSRSTRRLAGSGSGFKASQKTGPRLKVSADRLGEAGNRTCDPWFTRHRVIPFTTGLYGSSCICYQQMTLVGKGLINCYILKTIYFPLNVLFPFLGFPCVNTILSRKIKYLPNVLLSTYEWHCKPLSFITLFESLVIVQNNWWLKFDILHLWQSTRSSNGRVVVGVLKSQIKCLKNQCFQCSKVKFEFYRNIDFICSFW